MKTNSNIRISQSSAPEARQAVAEFHASVSQPDMELVIFFCSSQYHLDVLAAEMNRMFAGVRVVGCTTAGEIGPEGCKTHTLSGVSFSTGSVITDTCIINNLAGFNYDRGSTFIQDCLQRLERKAPQLRTENCFTFLMIDGLSIREDLVVHALQNGLGKIPLLGGSAGDDQMFAGTYVYYDGGFHSDSAVMILAATSLPFMIFKTQHFVSSEKRLVITEVDSTRRIAKEINGVSASQEYARLVCADKNCLDRIRFASFPLVVRIGDMDFVRSIQKVNTDGSLTFYCPIDEGLVLRLATGMDLLANLNQTFDQINDTIGQPQVVLGCDCVLRKIEIIEKDLIDRVTNIFKRNRMVGFNSYGEHFRGIHVNQTLTGIAIGCDRKTDDA
jgi:hypothetical protein